MTQIRYSYALNLAHLAGLHILDPDGPPLALFSLDEVNAAEKVLFAWYRRTKGIRKTDPAHGTHLIIGEAHLALIEIRWRLAGWRVKPLKPKHKEALENAVKVLPGMAAWCSNEYEKVGLR